MKRIFKYLLLIMFFFIININSVYAEESIKIKNIRVVDYSGTITLGTLNYSNNVISSNIVFNQLNDFVTYEIELQNDSNSNYPLKSITTNLDTNYLVVDSEDIGTTIEKNSTKTIRLKIKYLNELINVDEVNLGNMVLSLNYDDVPISNPTTGFNINTLIIPILLLMIALGFILFKIKKKQIILLIMILPMIVLAKEIKVSLSFNNVVVKGRMLQYRVIIDDGGDALSLREREYGEEVGEILYNTKSGYSFVGFEDQDGNRVTANSIVRKDTIIRAVYEPVDHQITYDLNGGVLSEDNPSTFTIESEFTLNNPTKEGYTFACWRINDYCYPSYTVYKGTYVRNFSSLQFEAVFSRNNTINYIVKHMLKQRDGYVEKERYVYSGAVGSTVSAQPKKYAGYTNIYSSSSSTTLAEGENNTLYVYYDKKECSFSVDDFDGFDLLTSTEDGFYEYGSIITLNAEERDGYTLWWSDGEVGSHRTFELTKDMNLKAIYVPASYVSYRVIHKLRRIDTKSNRVLDSYTVEDDEFYSGLPGDEIEIEPNIYEGFISPARETITLSVDGVNTITYYYDRRVYTLTIEEEENVETSTPSGEYYYGSLIELMAKNISGYSFLKWSDDTENNPYSFIIQNNITIRAIYEEASATFVSGESFNQKIKSLAGNSSNTSSTPDTRINSIVRADSLPADFSPTYNNIASINYSNYPIYIWYENNTIYYYTIAEKIYLNNNSRMMFYELRSLNSIDGINDWDTSKVTNMFGMFGYTGREAEEFSIDLSEWDTSNVTNMSSMFNDTGYSATTWNIEGIENWNTSNVTNMSYMFFEAGYNAKLFNIDLSGWDTSNVTNMSYMFSGAASASPTFVLDLSNWNVSNVTNMSYMFERAGFSSSSWSIGNISNWNVSNVTDMSYMFSKICYYNLTNFSLNLSNWNVSNVTNMSHMFSKTASYARTWSVGNLSNWNVSNVTDMSNMFEQACFNCSSWSLGNLSRWRTRNVTNMSNMFKEAGMTAVWSGFGTLNIYASDVHYMFYNAEKATISLNIQINPTSYYSMFYNTAILSNSEVVVNYDSDVSNIDNMIATKSNSSNVLKGEELSDIK